MGETHTVGFDKRLLAVMVIVCLALGGGFTLIYLDLNANFVALRNNYENLSAQIEQLQGLIDALHFNQTKGLTAVQIYNNTKYSVVIITTGGKTGTGFVYHAGGYIVTNNHVVNGTEGAITVTFLNGTIAQANFVGGDIYSDLSIIQVNEAIIPIEAHPLLLGNSTQLLVGEPVYAIGTPFGLSSSMTSGIVSQIGRTLRLSDLGVPEPWGSYPIADIIQFDAAVNPGNSGGPLLNSYSEVVGITFAIETADQGSGFIGIGYAIPSVLIKRVADSLIENGSYVHPWIGVGYDPEYIGGMKILSINTSGPADIAGLQLNDIITEVDGLEITRAEDLVIYLERYRSPGDVIHLKVVRNGVPLPDLVALTLGERN